MGEHKWNHNSRKDTDIKLKGGESNKVRQEARQIYRQTAREITHLDQREEVKRERRRRQRKLFVGDKSKKASIASTTTLFVSLVCAYHQVRQL